MFRKRTHLISMFLTIALLLGCGDDKTSGGPSTGAKGAPIDIATAKKTQEKMIHEAVGTIKANTASVISSKLMGTIASIAVKEGDRFEKDDALITIDPRQVTAQLKQAQAALEQAFQGKNAALSSRDQAESNANLARVTFERYEKLMAEASVSQQEFDEVKSRHLQAKAALSQANAMVAAADFQIKQAEAAVAAAKVNRQYAVITAPYNGYVTGKLINEGDLAAPGAPLLSIEGTGGYRVDTYLPEKYIYAVAPEQKVTVILPQDNGTPLEGTIDAISPAADSNSHSFLVKVAIPETDTIRAGMVVRVGIAVGTADTLMIPISTVIQQGQLTGLFLVDENRTAKFRLIRTGKSVDQSVEVLSGLKEGDRYVIHPPPDLVDGAILEVAS